MKKRSQVALLLCTTCCTRLATLLQHGACCWLKFENKIVKFFSQHFSMLHVVLDLLVWPRSGNIVALEHAHQFDLPFQSAIQNFATYCNRVAKRVKHVVHNDVVIYCVEMLRYVALTCCVCYEPKSKILRCRITLIHLTLFTLSL